MNTCLSLNLSTEDEATTQKTLNQGPFLTGRTKAFGQIICNAVKRF